jgi:hypothetical protein
MQKRAIIGTLILVLAFAVSSFVFQASVSKNPPACLKESSNPKKEKNSKLIWETLSQQFFPSTASSFTTGL